MARRDKISPKQIKSVNYVTVNYVTKTPLQSTVFQDRSIGYANCTKFILMVPGSNTAQHYSGLRKLDICVVWHP